MTTDPVMLAADATLASVLPAAAGPTAPAVGREPASRTVGELAHPPKTLIRADQTLREVANAFAVNGTTRAPVIDPADPGHFLGMVSLSALLHARRTDHHEEHHRERHLSLRISTETAASRPSAG